MDYRMFMVTWNESIVLKFRPEVEAIPHLSLIGTSSLSLWKPGTYGLYEVQYHVLRSFLSFIRPFIHFVANYTDLIEVGIQNAEEVWVPPMPDVNRDMFMAL